MRFIPWLILFPAVFCAGCQTPPNTELLEQENFQLGEQVTRLEVQMAHVCQALQECQCQLAGCQMAQATEQTGGQKQNGGSQQPTPADTSPPKVDLGEPGRSPKIDSPREIEPPPAPKFEGTDEGGTPGQTVSYRMPSDTEVTDVTLDSVRTVGLDLDPRPGDEGVAVALEPRNAAGELVPLPGEVEIAVWDAVLMAELINNPLRRDQAQVALWKFNTADAATWLRETPEGPKLIFDLIWPAGPPPNEHLQVFVRYARPDGQPREASAMVDIQLQGQRPNLAEPDASPTPATTGINEPTLAIPTDESPAPSILKDSKDKLPPRTAKSTGNATSGGWRPYQ